MKSSRMLVMTAALVFSIHSPARCPLPLHRANQALYSARSWLAPCPANTQRWPRSRRKSCLTVLTASWLQAKSLGGRWVHWEHCQAAGCSSLSLRTPRRTIALPPAGADSRWPHESLIWGCHPLTWDALSEGRWWSSLPPSYQIQGRCCGHQGEEAGSHDVRFEIGLQEGNPE